MSNGGKYLPLALYFENCKKYEFQLTFKEIEKIIHAELPKSSRKYSAWWANEKRNTHTHTKSWQDAGFHTQDLSLSEETVLFKKLQLILYST